MDKITVSGQFWSAGDKLFIDTPHDSAGVDIVCLNDLLIKDISQNTIISITIEVGTMSRKTMIAFIKTHPGDKITHELFDPHEYIYLGENGEVYDESGYLFEDWYSPYCHDGIRFRQGGKWETGWKIYNVKQPAEK